MLVMVSLFGCAMRGWWSSLLNTFGTNALAAYILHYSIMNHVNQLVPRDAPIWYVMLGFLLFFFITCVLYDTLKSERSYPI